MKEPKTDASAVYTEEEPLLDNNGIAFAESAQRKTRRKKPFAATLGTLYFAVAVFLIGAILGFCIAHLFLPVVESVVIGVIAGLFLKSCIRIAQQWENVVILRLGKLNRAAGPGLYFVIPIIEHAAVRVDKRIRCSFFSGEQILTGDLVPIDVNALLFWTVWDPKKACIEVQDFEYSVIGAAQTCMRSVIGSMDIEEMATRRKQIDELIKTEIDAITNPWGIAVTDIKIRDVVIPNALQDALSKVAQAERERDARMVLAEVENDISAMLVEAANEYDKNPRALQLRAIQAASESTKKGGAVVLPSSLGDAFGSTNDFLKHL